MEDDIGQHTKNNEVAPHSYIHIPITGDQANDIRLAMSKRTQDAGRYNILFRNCAQAVESFLNAGGVPGIPHGEINVPFVLHGILSMERTGQ